MPNGRRRSAPASGRVSGMADAVDVGSPEVERLAMHEPARHRRTTEHEPFLGHLAADHGHGAGGQVVIVEAGVVIVHPADQPDRELVVAQQLLVDAALGVVLDEMRPARRLLREAPHDRDELGPVHATRS